MPETDSRGEYPHGERTGVRRLPERGSHDRATVDAILRAGLVCHVGFQVDTQPYVIPMTYAPDGDRLILHGAPASRLLRTVGEGVPACVTVTLVDGLVLAGTLFDSSMNYRSVMALGTARPVNDTSEKRRALVRLSEHLVPGRTAEAPDPTDRELAGTAVLHFEMEEVSAKVRTGPPSEPDPVSGRGPMWRGVVPLMLTAATPEPAPDQDPAVPPPAYLQQYARPRETTA